MAIIKVKKKTIVMTATPVIKTKMTAITTAITRKTMTIIITIAKIPRKTTAMMMKIMMTITPTIAMKNNNTNGQDDERRTMKA